MKNIAEILRNFVLCRKLYSPIYGEVIFEGVGGYKENEEILVRYYEVERGEECLTKFDNFGRKNALGECLLFPSKDMRDWNKFEWKKGDVLQKNDNKYTTIFDSFIDETMTKFKGLHCIVENGAYLNIDNCIKETKDFLKADINKSHEHINNVERICCGKLNKETLEIEKGNDILVVTVQ